jgi:hypothetical protein
MGISTAGIVQHWCNAHAAPSTVYRSPLSSVVPATIAHPVVQQNYGSAATQVM